MNKLKEFIRVFLSLQFLTFLLVGGVNTLNGMAFPALLSQIMPVNVAYILSYIPSLGISYILNSFFTFKDKELTIRKCVKFYLSYMPNFFIQNMVFFVAYNMLHANKYVGIIAASVLGIPVTFLILKFFTFYKKEDE